MKVILTKEVLGLGDPGEIVTVKNGYGRNYLIPRGLAIEATKKNMALVEAERQRIQRQQAREAEKRRQEAAALEGLSVTIVKRAGETGKLYGSVTNQDIARALAELGHDIDRRRIIMEGPIKSLGTHVVQIKLHPQVVVDLTVVVETTEPLPAKEPPAEAEDQAEPQAEAEGQGEAEGQAEAPAQEEGEATPTAEA
jgi:large subunit ribosomal protein L9